MQAERVTTRQRAILTAIIESYIETGEPVGSSTISRLGPPEVSGLSPATIRNEMAALADQGLLEQPHTSAGRVPSALAFRLYVDQIRGGPSLRLLTSGLRPEIDSSFAGVSGTQAVLERTSHVLATLSSGVGVAVASLPGGDLLEHIHFSRLVESRVLAVVVMRSGLVRDRVLALDRDLPVTELERAANFLNEHFRGWAIENVRRELARLVERERSEYHRLLASIQQLWTHAMPESPAIQPAVYVEGVANLITSSPRQEDRDRLREILTALEAKQRVIELLNAYIDARQESVRVVFDLEEQAPELEGLVLIAAPARMAGESRGTVGVIGPKRMQYERTMSAVSYIARVFDRMLETPQ
ncbi:MAG TPA: heat-inducible transcriptional repressor HrcA [Granulicella sp.]